MERIISSLQSAISNAEDDKENLKPVGIIRTPALRAVARREFHRIKTLPNKEIFNLCETLLDSGDWRERTVAFQWAFQVRNHFQSTDFARFHLWLEKYVDDWGSCDDFCTHAFGHLLHTFSEHIRRVKAWTSLPNRWFRRASAVIMIYTNRRGENYSAAFEIADLLFLDHDDLVQKGYGWMLKEIGKRNPGLVFEFVMKRKKTMPRTALRFAIEKLDPHLQVQAMKK